MQFVKNEDALVGMVNMKYTLEQGDSVIILSELASVYSHFIKGTASTKGVSIAYMGDNSPAIKRDKLKTRTTYFYLAKVNGETVVLQTPNSLFWDMNKQVAEWKKSGRNLTKRDVEWEVRVVQNEETGYNDYFAEELAELSEKSNDFIVAGYNEMLGDNLRWYEEMLVKKYYERYPEEAMARGVAPAEDPKADEVDGQKMDQKINIDDIPF